MAGSYYDNAASTCQPCDAGKYGQSTPGISSSCTPCEAGKYSFPGASVCKDRTNKLSIGSFIYSTLHDVAVDYWGLTCGDTWAVLPSDWVLAPDNAASRSVARTYTWSTHCPVFAGGRSEASRIAGSSGECGSWPPYNQNGNQYKVSQCYTQLLILQ